MKRPIVITFVFFIIISILFSFLNGFAYPTRAQEPAITPGPVDNGEPIPPDSNVPPGDTGTDSTGLDFNTLLGGGYCTIQGPIWVNKSPLAQAAYGMGVASDHRYVYVAGGFTSVATNSFSRYDPALDMWTTITPLPIAVYDGFTIYAEGKIYVFGGINGSGAVINDLHIYNIAADTWTDGGPMPDVRQQMGGGYYNGKIYLVGGFSTNNVSSAQNQTWEYTLATNSWATIANLPVSLAGPGYGVVNGKLYILGGRDVAGVVLNSAYQYDIAGNSWSAVANLPAAINFPGSVVYGERVWIFGGGNPFLGEAAQTPADIEAYNTTYIYDPVTNTWQTGPAQNSARSFQGGAVVDNRIISVGGYSSSNSNAVEVLTQAPLRILIVYADANIVPASLRWQLLLQPGISQVDVFNAQTATPDLTLLLSYDMVVPFSNSHFADPIALGNVLADYQDLGGIVVGLVFDWYSGWGIAGRWVSGGYSPFNQTSTPIFSNVTLGSFTSDHPLMVGVSVLNVYFHLSITPAPGTTTVANWSDGQPAIAFKAHAVGINAYLGDLAGQWSGDFARVIANAGKWLWKYTFCNDALVCNDPNFFQGSIDVSDPLLTGRIFRDEPASTCSAPQSCSVIDSALYHYDGYKFWNNTLDSQCVTVTLDPKTCLGTNWLQSSAYLGSFNPISTCTNYLGDIGASPSGLKSYSFIVPAWSSYLVVVNEAFSNTFCPAYGLKISAGDCPIKKANLPIVVKSGP